MPVLQRPLRFFLSSTSVDLQEIRKEIIRFLGVLPADLLAMEFFGSDEAKPKDYCLEQVARSNFFIGIYAERYGSVDPGTGYSITELEYRKAAKMFRDGAMSSILIYMIDETASWPIQHWQRDPVAIEKLRKFKKLLTRKHTVTFFRNEKDLTLLVLKDVIEKIGVGKQALGPKAASRVKKVRSLARPIGMESFAAGQSAFFRGRDREIDNLTSQVVTERFSLLVGASGIGKSSLVQAGLLPRLQELGWRVAIVRPIAPVVPNLARQTWSQLMERKPPPDLTLAEAVKACTIAHGASKLAIVLDQFEDCAARPTAETSQLIGDLLELRNSNDCETRLLFSYRADAEAELGPIWQLISGSPGGLARIYLGPLSNDSAIAAFGRTLEGSSRAFAALAASERAAICNSVVSDLEIESLASGFKGIFPPFLQMVVSEISREAEKSPGNLLSRYTAIGGARKIISDFLLSQLQLLGNEERIGRQILISLVSSYGTKSQKSPSEIADESGSDSLNTQRILQRLLDLRLVREVQGAFEIIHDLVAHRIIDEIVSSDEKEAKRCQELLRSRTSAYQYTGSLLSYSEQLYVYRFRGRISVGQEHIRYLFLSALAHHGPIFYWLAKASPASVLAWTSERQLDLTTFRGVQLARNASGSLEWDPSQPKSLIPLLVDKNPAIREAAKQQLISISESVEDRWVRSLAASNSTLKRLALIEICGNLSLKLSLDEARKQLSGRPIAYCFLAAAALTRGSEPKDIQLLLQHLDEHSSDKLKFYYSFAAVRLATKLNLVEHAISLINHSVSDVAKGAISGADNRMEGRVLRAIAGRLQRWPELAAPALARLATADDIGLFRDLLSSHTSPIGGCFNEIVTGLLRIGDSSAVDYLLSNLHSLQFPYDLKYSDQLFEAAANKVNSAQMADFRLALDDPLFWADVDIKDRGNRVTYNSKSMELAFKSFHEHTFFLRWFVGSVFALLAERGDLECLLKLLNHSYWNLRKAAARRLAEVMQVEDLDRLLEGAMARAADEDDITRRLLQELDRRFYSPAVQASKEESSPAGQTLR